MSTVIFNNRKDAGRQLAEKLARFKDEKVTVLGLPRGGIVPAFEVARALRAPLDVTVARKIGAPGQPEFGIGAVAPHNVVLLNTQAVKQLDLSEKEVNRLVQNEQNEMNRRIQKYRGDNGFPVLRGRTAIIVDDGLATGVTARAAIQAVRKAEPDALVLAVPVCAASTAKLLHDEVDELICAQTPENFVAVGVWYREFPQTTDEEVVELLEQAHHQIPLTG